MKPLKSLKFLIRTNHSGLYNPKPHPTCLAPRVVRRASCAVRRVSCAVRRQITERILYLLNKTYNQEMNTKTEKAIETFRGGYNCAQAVLTAYSDELKFDREMAINVSCGFGGGMGRMQEKCGAVTGSFMVLSIYAGGKYPNNIDKKEKSYPLIR